MYNFENQFISHLGRGVAWIRQYLKGLNLIKRLEVHFTFAFFWVW